MLFPVAYDIPDDGSRTQVANKLEDSGARGSVFSFERDLNPTRCLLMAKRLRKLICANDSICINRVCRACAGELIFAGRR